jgi:hypothetical protein
VLLYWRPRCCWRLRGSAHVAVQPSEAGARPAECRLTISCAASTGTHAGVLQRWELARCACVWLLQDTVHATAMDPDHDCPLKHGTRHGLHACQAHLPRRPQPRQYLVQGTRSHLFASIFLPLLRCVVFFQLFCVARRPGMVSPLSVGSRSCGSTRQPSLPCITLVELATCAGGAHHCSLCTNPPRAAGGQAAGICIQRTLGTRPNRVPLDMQHHCKQCCGGA